MSSPPGSRPEPLIALADRLSRALKQDMVRGAHRRGIPGLKVSHDLVFATLPAEGARTADLAARAGVTRQSMGEVVRDLVDLGILEMVVDPQDRRAKVVTYTPAGREVASAGGRFIREREERFAAEVGPERYADMLAALARIAEVLEADDATATGSPPAGPPAG